MRCLAKMADETGTLWTWCGKFIGGHVGDRVVFEALFADCEDCLSERTTAATAVKPVNFPEHLHG